MTLNASGPISLAGSTSGESIALELGQSATAQISLNDSAVRTLANVASGAIVMPTNFYGKSNRAVLSYTYSANTTNASLNVASLSGYISGKSDITITINSGVYVYSTATGTPGLTLTGGTTGDTITIVNNGYILGMGGAGAKPSAGNVQNGNAAGNAISLGFNTTINNTNGSAYIAGGGGGATSGKSAGGGGGSGGGAGADANTGTTSKGTGGAGGGPGSAGSNGVSGSSPLKGGGTQYYGSGGGGGRILPGTGGVGGSGTGYVDTVSGAGGGSGGGGGSAGSTGGTGGSSNNTGGNSGNSVCGGGGGGWGATGGNAAGSGTGGAGGKAVALNGYTVTWTSGNTTRVYGAVS